MTGLIRANVVLALIFAVAAAAIPAYYKHILPDPPALQSNAEFQRNIASIADIEHLRKVLHTVVVGSDNVVAASKRTTDAAVDLLSIVLVLGAVSLGGSAVWLYVLKRKMDRTSP